MATNIDSPTHTNAFETAITAAEMGYFDVPRRATLLDVAETLEITDQQASRQLRTELAQLLENAGTDTIGHQ